MMTVDGQSSIHVVLRLLLLFGLAHCDGIKGPPHIVSSYEKRQIFKYGDQIKLDCPVKGYPTPIINWKKDGESITIGWDRYRTSNQILRIKEASQEDSGLFECIGVNGFGSETVNFNVIVLDPKYGNVSPSEFIPPLITEFVKAPDSPVQIKTGSTLKLRCGAEGFPEPTLTWYRDGRLLPEDKRSNRWTLQIDKVRIEDSGEYLCLAKNPLGSSNATFLVEITDREPRQPEFSEELVSSQSAVEGTTVKLQCKVKSDDEPFIQWLKRVESDTSNTQFFPISDAPITFGQWRYRVVRAGRVSARTDDGAYIDRLVFEHVSEDDSGTYVCVATNSVGYSFREASVRVLPPPSNNAGPLVPGQTSGLDSTSIIVLPIASIALIGIVAFCVYCIIRSRFQTKTPIGQYQLPNEQTTPCLPTPSSNLAEGHYAVPIDSCIHHQREKRVVYPQVTYRDSRYPASDQNGYLEPVQVPYTGSYPLLRDNYGGRNTPTYILPGGNSYKSFGHLSQDTSSSTGYIKCQHRRCPDIV
ncbi:fibroblast growth factor receptor-like 1 isoform X1 [Artemia franciscana]|uniref:fibroblast growth factor receptor-like 1 isoform X1 n=1 Tax=Artemia franciscana TaxID=6661 RepID=UPI0032DB58A9